MYNQLIEIVKTWHWCLQFIIFFTCIWPILAIVAFVIVEITRFFNVTLPTLIHGWQPSDKKNESEEND